MRSLSAASLANRSALNLSVFSRTNRLVASIIAFAPSLACSCFLKLASARARASSDLVVNVVSSFSDSGSINLFGTALALCMFIIKNLNRAGSVRWHFSMPGAEQAVRNMR